MIPWSLILQNKKVIIIGGIVLIVLGYVTYLHFEIKSLKSDINDLKSTIKTYKHENYICNKTNTSITAINANNKKSLLQLSADNKKLQSLIALNNKSCKLKEDNYLKLINTLKNRKPKNVIKEIVKLQKCEVRIEKVEDSKETGIILDILNNIGGQ